MTDRNAERERRYWLDQPRNIDRLVHLLWLICALLVAAEFFYHQHAEFGFAGWFAFYPAFGFLSYCFIVFSAKRLRRLLWRDENYYGEADADLQDSEARHE